MRANHLVHPVLQALNNLSDEQVEYQVRDRLSFSRFLGLAIEDSFRTPRRFGCSARSWPRPG
jgi:IS5 family transposase